MKRKPPLYLFLFIAMNAFAAEASALPTGFTYLTSIDPTIKQDIRYFTYNNFVGKPIVGYEAPKCILTKKAALALAHLQKELKKKSLGIKVYDCYRPQAAVDNFIAWSNDVSDQKMKKSYYPNINKADVFKLGYVAMQSSHTRGSTVDMEIVGLNMGTHFDLLDPISHPFSTEVPEKIRENRLFLRHLMIKAGFKPIDTEWWHFTLADEPYPTTYFNFPVK